MIYDCFLFWKEFELLEIRLHELASVVDRFVLVEATHTFSGLPKPLYYAENKSRFGAFADRIIHYVVDDMADLSGAWARDHHHRNSLLRPLADCRPDDIVMISDADEIPAADLVREHARFAGVTTFVHRLFYYFLNCEASIAYSGTRMLPYELFSHGLRPQDLRRSEAFDWLPQQIIRAAGWHFSYLGSAAQIREKIAAYAHQEYNGPPYTDLNHILQCMEEGRDLFGREQIQFHFVPIDGSYPRHVLDNLERFDEFIYRETMPIG